MKKILIGLAVVIFLISLVINGLYYYGHYKIFMPDISESNRAYLVTKQFGFKDANIDIQLDTTYGFNIQYSDEYLRSVDSVLFKLNTIKNELVGTSGGWNPEGAMTSETMELINSANKHYVQKYFYGNNYFRNNAYSFFKEIISDYLEATKSLNIKSSLTKSLEFHNKYLGGSLFDQLTITESLNLIELMKSNIIIDKYAYLSMKRK